MNIAIQYWLRPYVHKFPAQFNNKTIQDNFKKYKIRKKKYILDCVTHNNDEIH